MTEPATATDIPAQKPRRADRRVPLTIKYSAFDALDQRQANIRGRAVNELETLVIQCARIPKTADGAMLRGNVLSRVVDIGSRLFGWDQSHAPSRLLAALMGEIEHAQDAQAIEIGSAAPVTTTVTPPVAGELAECAPHALVSTNPPDAQPSQPVVP